MAETSLRLENLRKVFTQHDRSGEVVAVNNISLDIHPGEFVTFLGPSGCGKTTTLRLIAGFEQLSSGRLYLKGTDISNQPAHKRDMALVFQNYALFPHLSVFSNVAYGIQTRRLGRKVVRERVEEALSLVGLSGLGNRRPHQLSGGQQQRVALARSLVTEPSILLFDEPLSNLDAKLRVQMRNEIHRLQRRLNITSIYVTHDQTEAMALSDRIVVMNQGRIEQLGTPGEIYRTPLTRFVADFIGRANFLKTEIESVEGDQAQVRILGQMVTVPNPLNHRAKDTVEAMLRPESLSLVEDASLPQATIQQTMYLGSEVEYQVNFNGSNLIVVDNDPRTTQFYQPGMELGLQFMPETVRLLKE